LKDSSQSSPNRVTVRASYKSFVYLSDRVPIIVRFIHSCSPKRRLFDKEEKKIFFGYCQRLMAFSDWVEDLNSYLIEVYWDNVLEYCLKDFFDVDVPTLRLVFFYSLVYALFHELGHFLDLGPLDVRFDGGLLL